MKTYKKKTIRHRQRKKYQTHKNFSQILKGNSLKSSKFIEKMKKNKEDGYIKTKKKKIQQVSEA